MTAPPGDGGEGDYVAPPPYVRPPEAAAGQVGHVPYPPPGFPGQQPPGYGYPGYAPPPGYAAAPTGYPPAPQLSFGFVCAGLTGLGTVLLLISFIGLPWLSVGDGLSTGDIRSRLDDLGIAASDLSVAYFSWLAWVLLLLSAGSAIAAGLPLPGLSLAFRIAGPIVAGFAALFTFGAIQLTDAAYSSTQDTYVAHAAAGFWLAVAGFALIGAGAIVGPRRQNAAPPG